MSVIGANFSYASEAKLCDHLLQTKDLHVGVTPICNVRVRATGEIDGMDFNLRGSPVPEQCQGLKTFEGHDDLRDPCVGVERKQLQKWGWKLPPLNATLQLIHIPKTGGTTLEEVAFAHGIGWGAYKKEWNMAGKRPPPNALGKEGTWQPCSPWHIPPAFFRARGESGGIGAGSQQTFCVVRDPIERAISQFTFQIEHRNSPNQMPSTSLSSTMECHADALNAHIHQVLGGAAKPLARLEKAFPLVSADLANTRTCTECAAVADCHWLPQWLYVEGTCDYVLRFEHLADDFAALLRRFDTFVNDTSLASAVARADAALASTCNDLTRADLDAESRALLARVYAKDFEHFNYSRVARSEHEGDASAEGVKPERLSRLRRVLGPQTKKKPRPQEGATMSKYPPEAEEMADGETDSDDASDTALQATSGGCPECGYNHKGVANCCSHGGSWEGKCATDISLSGAQHTWIDGYNACNSLIVAAPGCTDSLSTNFVAEANVDDGSCLSFGCTDSLMANYDPTATEDDGCALSAVLNRRNIEVDPTRPRPLDKVQSSWVTIDDEGPPRKHSHVTRAARLRPRGERHNSDEHLAATLLQPQPEPTDAVVGAREYAALWRRRQASLERNDASTHDLRV
jgi:hypothetical protein